MGQMAEDLRISQARRDQDWFESDQQMAKALIQMENPWGYRKGRIE